MTNYKSFRIVDKKPRKVIVDENGKILNKNPTKEELKDLEDEEYDKRDDPKKYRPTYTDEDLLNSMKQFYEENGRCPEVNDFRNNSKYPGKSIYYKRFGTWPKSLEMAGLYNKRIIVREKLYTDEELLNYLRQFYFEYKKIPTLTDFMYNNGYPSFKTYQNRFGSWQNTLKLVGLDIDTIVIKGILDTNKQKARWFEIMVKEHFENESKDLSGDNCTSPFDGICPRGQTYDAKSSKFDGGCWKYCFSNLYIGGIDWFYLGGFNNNFKKLLYVWRIPGNFIDKNTIQIGIRNRFRYNIVNMKEYEITEKFLNILKYKNISK